MGREEGNAYINKLSETELMELILFGEDGQDAKDLTWLCSRLASKMMVAKESNDICRGMKVPDMENTPRQTIEKFFHVFGSASALANFRAITGFWQPSQAESAFTQTMLQFAQLPKNARDMRKNLYVEHYENNSLISGGSETVTLIKEKKGFRDGYFLPEKLVRYSSLDFINGIVTAVETHDGNQSTHTWSYSPGEHGPYLLVAFGDGFASQADIIDDDTISFEDVQFSRSRK